MISNEASNIPSLCQVVSTKKQDFNGGYCEATQENYDTLVKHGYKAHTNYPNARFIPQTLKVENDWVIQSEAKSYTAFKQFYIVDGTPTWDKPEEKEVINTVEEYDNSVLGFKKETLSITTEDGTVYEFEKPCEELELVYTNKYVIIGVIAAKVMSWYISGNAQDENTPYNLTPIKKAWYEDESNFPNEFLVVDNGNCLHVVTDHKNGMWFNSNGDEIGLVSNLRLATKEELLSLYVEE